MRYALVARVSLVYLPVLAPFALQFTLLAGFTDSVIEYNQEQLRVRAVDGGTSLVRSFPSRVAVSRAIRLQ